MRACLPAILLFLTFTSCSLLQTPSDETRRDPTAVKEIKEERYTVAENKAKAEKKKAEKAPEEARISEGERTEALKKRLLVLPFTNRTQHGGKELAEFAAEEIKNE